MAKFPDHRTQPQRIVPYQNPRMRSFRGLEEPRLTRTGRRLELDVILADRQVTRVRTDSTAQTKRERSRHLAP